MKISKLNHNIKNQELLVVTMNENELRNNCSRLVFDNFQKNKKDNIFNLYCGFFITKKLINNFIITHKLNDDEKIFFKEIKKETNARNINLIIVNENVCGGNKKFLVKIIIHECTHFLFNYSKKFKNLIKRIFKVERVSGILEEDVCILMETSYFNNKTLDSRNEKIKSNFKSYFPEAIRATIFL